jgi:hypothetical protein
MSPQPAGLSFVTSIVDGTGGEVLDVLGPAVEFLYVSEGPYEQFCLMRGVVPPGVTVPLHSHDDVEAFFIVSGSQEVLVPGSDGLEWRPARAGDDTSARGASYAFGAPVVGRISQTGTALAWGSRPGRRIPDGGARSRNCFRQRYPAGVAGVDPQVCRRPARAGVDLTGKSWNRAHTTMLPLR